MATKRHRVGSGPKHTMDPSRLTERGLSALAAARKGAQLYVYRNGKWREAGPRELAKAERLVLARPSELTGYATEAPPLSVSELDRRYGPEALAPLHREHVRAWGRW